MKINIRKKHMKKNILLKKILSSYVVAFLIITSFSLIVFGVNETVRGAKKLFTTTANENAAVPTDPVNTIPANKNSVVVTDSSTTDENSNEDDEDESDFWNWIADYDKDDKDLNLFEYNYSENYESNGIIGHGFIFKLRNKIQNNKCLLIANYLFLKFENHFQ